MRQGIKHVFSELYLEPGCRDAIGANELHGEQMHAQVQGLGRADAAGVDAGQVAALLLSPGLDHLARVAAAVARAEAEVACHIPAQHQWHCEI